ncbi:histone acetyltransferase p300 isoform X1 [Cloeon dipterum]|uniref:histone acetyltransferase p300 isoform X1 n=1 Tax=Cloeon dipterum TaxID=197152 RepID=UPI00321F8730
MDQKNEQVTYKVALYCLEGKLMELRKFTMEKSAAGNFINVHQRICNAFPKICKANSTFDISFLDSDGDNITISTDEELKFVTSQKGSVWKLQVHLRKETSKEANALMNGNSPQKVVHKNFRCNECSEEILGNRYRCVVCLDYDVCGHCEPNSHHEHAMLKLPKPINNVETMVAHVCRVLSILLSEQDCSHKNCSNCSIRRSCNGVPKEGSLNKAIFNLAKTIEQEVGMCNQCGVVKPQIIDNGQLSKSGSANAQKFVPIGGLQNKPNMNGNTSAMRPLSSMPIMRVSPTRQPISGGPVINAGAMVAQGPPLHYQPNFFPYLGMRPAASLAPSVTMGHFPHHPLMPPLNQNFYPSQLEDYFNPFLLTPAVPLNVSSHQGNSQASSPKIEEESVDVQIQRAVLQLSAKGYVADVEKMGAILRSVDLNVEKACKILDEEDQ